LVRLACLFLTVILLINFSSVAYAISDNDRQAILKNTVFYDPNAVTGCTIGGLVIDSSKLPSIAQGALEANRPLIEEYKPYYDQVAEEENIPWQALAALHYRESSLSLVNPSNGEGLFGFATLKSAGYSFPPGPITFDEFVDQLRLASSEFKKLASGVYAIDITSSGSTADFEKAFLAYNRGARYKNAVFSIGREMLPIESPYVYNQIDSAHINMYWPDGGETPRAWGEPAVTRNKGPHTQLGALTMMLGYSFIPGVTVDASSCSIGIGLDGFVFPLATTKDVIDVGSNYPSSGGYSWCKRNCHNTPPAWAPYLAHDIGAPKFSTPVIASQGGTVTGISVTSNDKNQGQMSLWVIGDDGLWYWYQHNDPDYLIISEGTRVEAGQEIARVGPYALNGNTSSNTPPHLHFSISTKRITRMMRGCTQAVCPDMDGFVDSLGALLSAYENLPIGAPTP
jgi:murein DD-endopeptidase MepM/ murein hydrolase activator NlpD